MELQDLRLTPHRLEICKKLSLFTIEDILRYYPSRYEERVIVPYTQWKVGMNVLFGGEMISSLSSYRARRGLSISRFKLLYEGEEILVTVFNQPWLRLHGQVSVIGKYDGANKVTATQVSMKSMEEKAGIEAFYPLKDGIKQNDIRKIIQTVYQKAAFLLPERIPAFLSEKHHLMGIQEAIKAIHFPEDVSSLKQALARFKYEEFLRFYVVLAGRKLENAGQKTGRKIDYLAVNDFIASYPFTFTTGQKEAVNQILQDLQSAHRMNRLLQGDVGCGKTAVAEVAIFAAVQSGCQVAFMAPTEILAKQHYQDVKMHFKTRGYRVALLTSSSEEAELVRQQCKEGTVDIVIGTHALFAQSVHFQRLGLVITDEQQRFGVLQHRKLQEKGQEVDVLAMSATPIPRTLAATLLGFVDITTIETLPAGRKGCDTYLLKENSIRSLTTEMRKKIQEGRQIYVIGASIDASENLKVKDVIRLQEALASLFPETKVALLHGRMDTVEKEKVMQSFADGETKILVATTVVEVGVNVPNATMMVIYDADRFGLSQLHQLRGRIQRSIYRGSCYLLSASQDPETLARLEVLLHSNDGFAIAEADLRLRGPGDLLGTRQSGLPSFVLGNPVHDKQIMTAAKNDAFTLWQADPTHLTMYKRMRDLLTNSCANKV